MAQARGFLALPASVSQTCLQGYGVSSLGTIFSKADLSCSVLTPDLLVGEWGGTWKDPEHTLSVSTYVCTMPLTVEIERGQEKEEGQAPGAYSSLSLYRVLEGSLGNPGMVGSPNSLGRCIGEGRKTENISQCISFFVTLTYVDA